MSPTSHDRSAQGGAGGDLESRLRGLILSNANTNSVPTADTHPSTQPPLPPNASAQRPGEQQYQTRNPSQPPAHSTLPPSMAGPNHTIQHQHGATQHTRDWSKNSSSVSGQPQQPGRKRLNQAQRRQMNSQSSVPAVTKEDPGTQIGAAPALLTGHTQPRLGPVLNDNTQARYNPRNPQRQQYPQRPASQGPTTYSPQATYSQVPLPPAVQDSRPGPSLGHEYLSRQGPHTTQHYPAVRGVSQGSSYGRAPPRNQQLYQPNHQGGQGRGRQFVPNLDEISSQSSQLATLVNQCATNVGIDPEEEAEKEEFRSVVEHACREAIVQYEQELGNSKFDRSTVELKCFGSMSSGFATKASDMDLALLTPLSNPAADSPESRIPRLLERTLLDLGYGARLLTRTRVPIIKLCQKPTKKLLSDLLDARTKWEDGFALEQEDEDGDGILPKNGEVDNTESRSILPKNGEVDNTESRSTLPKASEVDNTESRSILPKASEVDNTESRSILPKASEVDNTEARPILPENEFSKLKQRDNQSLGDYFNTAKRSLRKVGGRDVSAGSPPLSKEECDLLNDVCKAFISGLSSDKLSKRLRTYASLSPLFDPSLPHIQRSLNGVWTQTEGERFAMSLDRRSLLEPDEKREQECLKTIEDWNLVQNGNARLVEPLFYNRQLYVAAEKLKAISSLQLVLLEQIQHEDPVYYQNRAQRLLNDLKGRHQDALSPATPIVISHYISGISSPQIREAIQSSPNNRDLKDVAMQHRMLHLAIDYEHALNKDLYTDDDRPIVERYIEFLRSKTRDNPIEPSLLAKIRTLPDPTAVSPNKPRDQYRDPLEFPKTEIGIQCDINFSAHLALHNTLLLRCYSRSDPRVKPLILFVKHWAKVREINTPYRGSLSSYGYVLMVLHYLVNVSQPFVCPNLQLLHREPPSYLPAAEIEARTTCSGRDVRFWRNEPEIQNLASRGMLNHNQDSIGTLLRGFFEYFAHGGQMSTVHSRGFDWGREVLSIRTQRGIVSKLEKGWVGAKTVTETTTIAAPPTPSNQKEQTEAGSTAPGKDPEAKPTKQQVKTMEETKEIRHRYLFAIEDPFELDHNVARTVTHNGIVAIRDEFRRAWRLIKSMDKPGQTEGLLDPVKSEDQASLQRLFDLIHGKEGAGVSA